MATSTLIQFLAPGEAGDTSHRRQTETYIASGAIAAGDVVAFDDGQTGADRALYVEQAGIVATGNGLAAGVATAAAAAGEQVRVIVAGYAEGVSCAGGVATGAVVNAAGTAAGQVEAAVASDTAVFGVTVGPEAGNRVDMIIYKRF
jgi:hypothetical protein